MPTLGVAGWCASRHWFNQVAALERQLTAELGLAATLEDVEYLRPGVTLLKGIALAEPETGQLVFRARQIEASDSQGALVLVVSQPEVGAARLARVWQLLEKRLRGETPEAHLPVRFLAGEMTLMSESGGQTFTEVRGQIERTAAASTAAVSFRLAGVEMAEAARIRIERNRQGNVPASKFEFHTGGAALPCSTLLLPVTAADSLGLRSTFRGYLWARETPAGWEGELSGQFSAVDLQQVVTARFPHQLGGTAEIMIQKAVVRAGRVEEASGMFSAGPGQISRSLMTAAIASMGLRPGLAIDSLPDLLPYDQLAFAFVLDSQGLTLAGQCPQAPQGTVLISRATPVLGEPVGPPRPVVGLVRALVPHSEVLVPATRETDWLLNMLPLPRVVPASATKEAPPARLRVGRSEEGK